MVDQLPDDWWPKLLADFAVERPWDDPQVVLAEVCTIDDNPTPGQRHLSAALVPIALLEAALGSLREFGYKVDATGPGPGPVQAGEYAPAFWIFAGGLPDRRSEALILSWETTNRVVFTPSPEFLVTYGLVPRLTDKNEVAYDDLRTPVHDVVKVRSPAFWDSPRYTPARVTANRDYIQDYLSLRGMALVQGYYLKRHGPSDPEIEELLAGKDGIELRFADRLVDIRRSSAAGDTSILVQVWGAHLLAEAGALPVTVDSLDQEGLIWPGIPDPVTRLRARGLMGEWVFVSDAVLESYEDVDGFAINPGSGSVSWQGQWSIGFCHRVGRDAIKLEVRKLYEGAPDSVVRHWHSYALNPPQGEAADRRTANMATRSQAVVMALLELGELLEALAGRLRMDDLTAESFVGLDRGSLEYHGWWNASRVRPNTRAAALTMNRDAFLRRCAALNQLVAEGPGVGALRRLCRVLGAPDDKTANKKSLSLLDIIVRGCAHGQRAIALPDEAADVYLAVNAEAPPSQPIACLFAVNDLRNLGSHFDRDAAERFRGALGRLGVPVDAAAAGYGRALDVVYDRVAAELSSASRAVGSALR